MKTIFLGFIMGLMAMSCSFYDCEVDCAGRFEGQIVSVENGKLRLEGEAEPLAKLFSAMTPVTLILDEAGSKSLLETHSTGDSLRIFFQMDERNVDGADGLVHLLYY